jgi:DNA-binding response OmpR family regulator
MLNLIAETARQLQTLSTSAEPAALPAFASPRFLEGRGLLLDREQETVTCNGEPVALTPTEFQLLSYLMGQAGQAVSYRELIKVLHGYEGANVEKWEAQQALSTHLWRLRHKLGQDPDGKPYIVNVRGRGYKFVAAKD